MFTAMTINGNPADGYSSGEAIKAIEEVAAETLPVGYGYEFSGMTREEQGSSSGTTAIIFMLCLVFVYLLLQELAALFHPGLFPDYRFRYYQPLSE